MRQFTIVACAVLGLLATGCFESSDSYGGETHFMRSCEGEPCGDGLACVCGVCTQACAANAACSGLADGASCAAVATESAACGQESTPPARACALTCVSDATCSVLGGGFVCGDGECRERERESGPGVFVASGNGGAGGGADAGGGETCEGGSCEAIEARPLVMLLVDTSGSMERKASCTCTTPSCLECLPDCERGERNRWMNTLEALTGTMSEQGCDQVERTTEAGATYDVGYYLPHFAPRGAPGDDGVLDEYRDRVRFGLATFDGWDTYQGATPLMPVQDFDLAKSAGVEGLWSYNPSSVLQQLIFNDYGKIVGTFHYPGNDTDYFMDTGVRNSSAAQGGLRAAIEPASARTVNEAIQADLAGLRPYGGTPIAAALDDLYYYFARDPALEAERARPAEKHVVLITDGYPDADYREVGCNCGREGDSSDLTRCGGDPSNVRYDPDAMACPYPESEDAALNLRCGLDHGPLCSGGPVTRVHVVGYAIEDTMVIDKLQAMAIKGSDESAHFADSPEALRAALEEILDAIAP